MGYNQPLDMYAPPMYHQQPEPVSMPVSMDTQKYNKAAELVTLFSGELDALGAAVEYLEAMQMRAGGSRKRMRTDMSADPYGQMGGMGGMGGMQQMAMAPQYFQATPQHQGGGRSGGAPVAGEDGNWKCNECSNVNFGMRDSCNRCKADKPPLSEIAQEPVRGNKPIAGEGGNWECVSCQGVNFASREICFSCNANKDGTPSQGGKPRMGGGGSSGGAPRDGEGGNWRCGSCTNINFPARSACNRCKEPKPMMMMDGMGGGMMPMGGGMGMMGGNMMGGGMMMGGMGGGMGPMGGQMGGQQRSGGKGGGAPQAGVDGNWACDCGNVNFKFRESCNKCSKSKA